MNLLVLVVASLLALSIVPYVIRASFAIGAVDQPRRDRWRMQIRGIPRYGGVALAAALLFVGLPADLLWGGPQPLHTILGDSLVPFLAGLSIIFFGGLYDDLRGMPAVTKLLVQVIAASIVVAGGFSIERVALLPGLSAVSWGAFAPALTVLWIVSVTNAVNLIDGIDGLATSTGIVALCGTVAIELLCPQPLVAPYAMATVGALIAFLHFNRHPARIYLGDCGSMMLGFLLAVRTVLAGTNTSDVTFAFVPLALLAYPLLDMTTAVCRRWLRGQPIMQGDGRHIHHRLLAIGLRVPQALLVIVSMSAVLALVAVFVANAPETFAAPTAFLVLGALLALVTLGARRLWYTEFLELGRCIVTVVIRARSTLRYRIRLADLADGIRLAPDVDAIRTQLLSLVDGYHVAGLEVGVERPGYSAALSGVRPYTELDLTRHEHRVAIRSDEGQLSVISLRCWTTRHGARQHVMDQMLDQLAPAVARWLADHARTGSREFVWLAEPRA